MIILRQKAYSKAATKAANKAIRNRLFKVPETIGPYTQPTSGLRKAKENGVFARRGRLFDIGYDEVKYNKALRDVKLKNEMRDSVDWRDRDNGIHALINHRGERLKTGRVPTRYQRDHGRLRPDSQERIQDMTRKWSPDHTIPWLRGQDIRRYKFDKYTGPRIPLH